MSIKMIVVDLDGTLLRDNKTVSARTASALATLRLRGVKVVYATARGKMSPLLPPYDWFDGRANDNGAEAFIGTEKVYSRILTYRDYAPVVRFFEENGIKGAVTTEDMVYCNFPLIEDWTKSYPHTNADLTALTVDATKLWAYADTPESAAYFASYIPPDNISFWIAHDGFAMIMHKDATKSKGIAALADAWGIMPKEIMAFGDDVNDIDMLNYVGVGVAMGNALPAVKAAARFVTATNENDGIAEFLESYFDNDEKHEK